MGLSQSSDHRTLALIVDDDQEEREEYADNFARNGISTVEAEDGLHGIAKAASLLPDIIAVDLGRPGGDIFDMCFRLKRQHSTKHIPIIAVTEMGTVREIDQALRAGCVSVLVKPCRPNVLLAEIRRVLVLPDLPAA
jgi:two-component system cell cycle response regulator DivK